MIEIIVIILLTITVVGLIIYSLKNKTNLVQIQKENSLLEGKITDLSCENKKFLALIGQMNRRIDEITLASTKEHLKLTDKIEILSAANLKITDELNNAEKQLVEMNANSVIASVKENYNVELEQELKRLEEQIKLRSSELELISTNAASIAADEKKKLRRLEELEALIKASEGRIESGKKVLEEIEVQRKEMKNSLDQLSVLHRSVLAMEDGPGVSWTFAPGGKIRLVELIHQLVDEYGSAFPILRKELLKAEWSSVWLPQVQQLCSREGLDRSGIYKLALRSDPKIVYIGQAQSIKDRWYMHIKKMLGVEAKGTERLYEYKPDDFEWSVVEFKEGNLDSDERYWIDYYGCREIGLNKKG